MKMLLFLLSASLVLADSDNAKKEAMPAMAPMYQQSINPTTIQYEFKVIRLNMGAIDKNPTQLEDELNKWGKDGWEVKTQIPTDEDWISIVVLQRVKKSS